MSRHLPLRAIAVPGIDARTRGVGFAVGVRTSATHPADRAGSVTTS